MTWAVQGQGGQGENSGGEGGTGWRTGGDTGRGSGESPKASDTVEVHYEGTLIDGTIFDSSYARGESISFPLSAVIAGWTEGLQLMKVGGKAKLTIPSDIAYGDRGSPPKIPPKSTLVFQVELIAIK